MLVHLCCLFAIQLDGQPVLLGNNNVYFEDKYDDMWEFSKTEVRETSYISTVPRCWDQLCFLW